ncbi:MAG: molybdopterin-dependent oxidoreductase [Desulfococcaceae bacterium]|nr:molybdopterin-dependent oxidoreductase [Desulfococcaceae bacterium]
MARQTVYSVCGMCTVRCPIIAEVEDGRVVFLRGNPHAPGMGRGVCARGAAGIALIEDSERPQTPLIRKGNRGEGKWQKVSWDDAFDHVAENLSKTFEKYGPRSLLLTDRGGPFRDIHRAFLRGIGTPNYCNHDGACARNVQHSALSVFGGGRKDVVYDLKNARHVVTQCRNIFEAINVREVNELTAAMEKGCRLSVIDIRSSVTAAKAHNFFQVRPGTDYAFNLAVIHELIDKKLYDADYVNRYFGDFDKLEDFVRLCTPEWAEQETGVSALRLRSFVKELAEAAPAVLWHPGWMTARYKNSFYVSRTIYIINCLLGSVGAKGGLPITNKPGDYNRKGLQKFMDIYDKPSEKRADGAGWKYPHFEAGPGVTHLAYKALETQEPYPIKSYIAYRHDPLMAFADPDHLLRVFSNLDFMVSVTFSWSDTAWYSDVVLPLSPYLERESIVACKNDLLPYLFVRKRAVEPRYDTKAEWEIFSGLSKRLGLKELVFESAEDVWNYQLEGSGVRISDFDEKGVVLLGEKAMYRDRDSLTFKTPSGKIEIISERLKKAEISSLPPYESPVRPPKGTFRLTFGRCGVHTQGHTVNNPMLFEQMPENVLWINNGVAEKLDIADGELLEVSNADGYTEKIKAFVTDQIHPDAVFTVHGFGHRLPVESRAKGRGLADNRFMPRGNDLWDKAGGAVALQEHFVSVKKASESTASQEGRN